jgi:hypothetical protein
MKISCEAENLFVKIQKYLLKLSDETHLSKSEDKELRSLLDEYWNIKCPEGKDCLPNTCSFASPISWVEYHGYTSLGELLWYFEYEGVKKLKLNNKSSIDTLDAYWARRNGHYNP